MAQASFHTGSLQVFQRICWMQQSLDLDSSEHPWLLGQGQGPCLVYPQPRRPSPPGMEGHLDNFLPPPPGPQPPPEVRRVAKEAMTPRGWRPNVTGRVAP